MDSTKPSASVVDEAVLKGIRSAFRRVILGKDDVIDLLLVGLLSGGHVLVEDVPGVGKTTLAKTLARVFAVHFTRIQFTPDLLPADILGSAILNPKEGTFHFKQGPVFANVVLADEINRASPRTQSALLEAMNEGQVTVDGVTHKLPDPFFVIATQNPVDHQGTYPLPEAQLDRFLLRFGVGYPAPASELEILYSRRMHDPLTELEAVASSDALCTMQQRVREVQVSEPVARYVLRMVGATRNDPALALGVSPRGALSLFRGAQARAFLCGRSYVTPDDVQALAGPVLAHRVVLTAEARYGGTPAGTVIASILSALDVPT